MGKSFRFGSLLPESWTFFLFTIPVSSQRCMHTCSPDSSLILFLSLKSGLFSLFKLIAEKCQCLMKGWRLDSEIFWTHEFISECECLIWMCCTANFSSSEQFLFRPWLQLTPYKKTDWVLVHLPVNGTPMLWEREKTSPFFLHDAPIAPFFPTSSLKLPVCTPSAHPHWAVKSISIHSSENGEEWWGSGWSDISNLNRKKCLFQMPVKLHILPTKTRTTRSCRWLWDSLKTMLNCLCPSTT